MEIEHSVVLELERRAQVLPADVARWRSLTRTNAQGFGINGSQVEAIDELLETLLERTGVALGALKPEETDNFPEQRLRVERELSGAHGVMGVFQYMLEQRAAGSGYREALDASDLICAGCYRLCIEKAQEWGALPPGRPFRAPPLTYLNAALSPTAATRRHTMRLFGMPGEGLAELKLPISVLSLPFDHTAAFWTYCALYHEVGHPLDQDLQIAEALENHVEAAVAPERWARWRWWLREIIADAFGVMLGGVAYARSLARLLMRAASDMQVIDPEDRHPNSYIRLFLVTSMLRVFHGQRQGQEFAAAADELENLWRTRYAATPQLDAFEQECTAVASAVLGTQLEALRGHAVQEFGVNVGSDHRIMLALSQWMRVGGPQSAVYAARHTAGAAQLALDPAIADAAADDTAMRAVLERIHGKARELVAALPRPNWLAGPGDAAARRRYFRELSLDLSFENV